MRDLLTDQQHFNPRSPQGGATGRVFAHVHGCSISIHAPRKGERRGQKYFADPIPCDFNPRSPQGGATIGDAYVWGAQGISIHAPRKGERRPLKDYPLLCVFISIHAPRKGERHRLVGRGRVPHKFQSTLPARGSDQYGLGWFVDDVDISIHAPRKGERLA